ncbi:lipoprotein 17-related variable surface protein [Mycoplasmopsis iners]|uniref:lipoprotein 17-related variable surface protein n=1 Tax=Mycoplasmopsis iners TaxID=76630 RepID=UPI0004958AF6|nr:lipoprotein 17-related variable surface protein [Mycoplasmopsis iners]
MRIKKLSILLGAGTISSITLMAAQCTSEEQIDNSKERLLNEELDKLEISPKAEHLDSSLDTDLSKYNVLGIDTKQYTIAFNKVDPTDELKIKHEKFGKATINVSIKEISSGAISPKSRTFEFTNLKLAESVFDEVNAGLVLTLKDPYVTEEIFQSQGENGVNKQYNGEFDQYVTISSKNYMRNEQGLLQATFVITDKRYEDNKKEFIRTFTIDAMPVEKLNEAAREVTFGTTYNAYNLMNVYFADGLNITIPNSAIEIEIDDSSFVLTEAKKVQFSYKAKQKQTQNYSEIITVEVMPANEALTDEEYEAISQLITIKALKGEEVPSIEELVENPAEWTTVVNEYSDYVAVTILSAEKQEDSNIVNVKYKLTDKFAESGESQEITVEITGLISKAKKDLANAEKIATAGYEGDIANLDANELEIAKVTVTTTEGYMAIEKAFVNEQATTDELDNGYREVKFKLQKDETVSENFITRRLETHKTSKEYILDKREIMRGFTLVQNAKVKEILSTKENGAILAYNYREAAVMENDIVLFTLGESGVPIKSSNVTTYASDGEKMVNGKVQLVVNGEGNDKEYSLTFTIGRYNFDESLRRMDNKVTTTTPAKLNTIYTQSELEAKATEFNETIDYPNKETTLAVNAEQANLTKGELNGLTFEITSWIPNQNQGEINITYKLSQEQTGMTVEVIKNKTINGFKQGALTNVLDDTTAELENKSEVLPTNVEANNIKIMKDNAELVIEEGITVTKSIEDANDSLGTLTFVVTLTKDDDKFVKKYELSGFKQGNPLDVEEIATHLTATFNGDKESTNAYRVTNENITLALDSDQKEKVDLTMGELKINAETGVVVVPVTVANKEDSSNSTTKEITIDGFQLALADWAVPFAKNKNLFVIDESDKAALKEHVSGKLKDGMYLIRIDANVIKPQSKKDKNIDLKIKINPEAIQAQTSVDGQAINTHGREGMTISNATKLKGTTKGVGLYLIEDKVVIKFVLLTGSGERIETIYEQELA